MSDKPLFGIDFGTSFSTACWWNPKSGMPEVIRNEHGEEKTPSLVYRGPEGVLIGKAAADQLTDSAHMSDEERRDVLSRTFQGIKRRLGENLPMALPDGSVVTPVELTAEILKHIKRSAEQRCFNGRVFSVVMTHPVMFTQREKDHLSEAGIRAGFNEVILIEEPVAAVLGYVASGAKAGGGILVYDLGGGTLDLAFVKQESVTDYHIPVEPCGVACGGDDFDQALYDHFERVLQSEQKGGFSVIPGAVNLSILMECRRCKEKLSSMSKARLSYFLPETSLHRVFEMVRSDFDGLIRDRMQQTISLTRSMLKRIQDTGHVVDSVLLVGGSTRIPLIRHELKGVLPAEPLETMHADVAVAMGAAVAAQRAISEPERYLCVKAPVPAIGWREAVEKGDCGQIRLQVLQGADVNAPFEGTGLCPLHLAVKHSRCAAVALLVELGANVDQAAGGDTPLHTAVRSGALDALDCLLKAGAKHRTQSDAGDALIHVAFGLGRTSSFHRLIGAHTEDEIPSLQRAIMLGVVDTETAFLSSAVNVKDVYGEVALHWAARMGNLSTMKTIIAAGGEVNAKGNGGSTPLCRAAQYGHEVLVRALIAAGADIGAKDKLGFTPLHLAAQYGQESVVRALLAAGADIEAKTDKTRTPLHLAAQNGQESVVSALLACGSDIEAKTDKTWTPLHLAAQNGQVSVVRVLLACGADIEAKTDKTCTPLHLAAMRGHESVVKTLFAAGADIGARCLSSLTPLHLAAMSDHVLVVKALIEAGAEVEAEEEWVGTPLHRAARNGHVMVVKALLEAHAEIGAKDKWAYTPLHWAAQEGHEVVVKALLTAGAEIEAKDQWGRTPIYRATDKGREAVAAVLRAAGAQTEVLDRLVAVPVSSIAKDSSAQAALYLVIDLSAGPATTRYPVSYLTVIPTGGWTAEYKTTKMVFRRVPAGTFTMGSPAAELGRGEDESQHQVTLTQPFYMGVFEVTQKQWERVMGTWPSWFNPSYFSNADCRDTRPVERVSYNDIRGANAGAHWPASSSVDADSFMGRLRAKTCRAFDLPTESQWEYACRAQTEVTLNSSNKYRALNGSSQNVFTCGDTSIGYAKVGSYLPNEWGLYDIYDGGVSEWCLDWYGTYPGTVSDPKGASLGSCRVGRGGGLTKYYVSSLVGNRHSYCPDVDSPDVGFRVALPLGQ